MALTEKDNEIILHLFKNYSKEYNANSLSKEIEISPRGALKILKKLDGKKMVIGKKMGGAIFYRLNLEDHYISRIIETLLMSEAREKASRWLNEFNEVYNNTEIIIVFGSIIREYKSARDIDILFVLEKNQYHKINSFIEQKNKVLLKPIHGIMQTVKDLKSNLSEKNPVIEDAIKTGYVVHGYEKLIEVIKNVRSV